MLGRWPSRGGCGLSPSASIRRLPAFEPPRQQPLAAAGPSLSKEGSNFHPWRCRAAACAVLLFSGMILSSGEDILYAQLPQGLIAGSVSATENSQGIRGVQVTIVGPDEREFLEVETDRSGHYQFLALAPNRYELKFQKAGYATYLIRVVKVQSGRTSYVDVEMEKSPSSVQKTIVEDWRSEPLSPWRSPYGNAFDRWQLTQLASARNIWALLENQVPSAVTNRVDEGGIATGVIGLVGVHGGSWTQNGYRFDGINVTDPYETGKPLVYPDFGSLQEFQVTTASQLSAIPFSSASFSLTSRQGGSAVHGEVEGYYLGEALQSSNLDARLEHFGFTTTPHFKHFGEGQFALGGPAPHLEKWNYFVSLGIQHLSKVVPDFTGIPTTSVYSGLLRVDGSLSPQNQLAFLATGQVVNNSNLSAGPNIAPSATLRGNDRFEVVQGHWIHRRSPATTCELGFGFSHSSPTDTYPSGITEPNRTQLFTGEMTGAAPVESDSARTRFSLTGQAQSWQRLFGGQHLLSFGVDLEESLATEARRVFGDIQMLFFPPNVPAEVIEYNTPSRPQYRLREFSLFFDDHFQLSNRLFLRFGLRFDASHGFLPSQSSPAGTFVPMREFAGASGVISWASLSPRVGIAIPVLKRFGEGLKLSASFARYPFPLSMRYLSYANPTSLGGQVFSWSDKNQNGFFEVGEEGPLLHVFGGPYSSVDPQLQRPFTDEWELGLEQLFTRRFQAGLRLFRRDSRKLAETINTGVPFSAYTPVQILDLGDDNIPGTSDDQILTVFNQDPSTLGKDHFLLTNPPNFHASYKGLEATVRKELADRWFLMMSFTAYKAVSPSSPGNSEFENDPGLIGTLFDNPNTLLNARGRLFFDRAFVGKVAAFGKLPFELYVGTVVKYADGLPFGRRLIVSGFNQGPFFVMATPKGNPGGLRTQFNLNFDQRIGRDFKVGRSQLSLLIDIFNLLNRNGSLREFDISGSLFPLRVPLEVQNPRVIRLGINWKF